MAMIKSEYGLGNGYKKEYTTEDINHIETLLADTLNVDVQEIKNAAGFEIEIETNGIVRNTPVIRPANKLYVNENDFIAYATRHEDGKTIVTLENDQTGEYSDLYDPSEWNCCLLYTSPSPRD